MVIHLLGEDAVHCVPKSKPYSSTVASGEGYQPAYVFPRMLPPCLPSDALRSTAIKYDVDAILASQLACMNANLFSWPARYPHEPTRWIRCCFPTSNCSPLPFLRNSGALCRDAVPSILDNTSGVVSGDAPRPNHVCIAPSSENGPSSQPTNKKRPTQTTVTVR